MKFLIQIVVIGLLAFVAEIFLDWWSIAIAAGIGGYFFKSKANFLSGFLAIAFLWIVIAWKIDSASPSHLAEKVAAIFKTTKPILTMITGVLGGLVGGMGALTGSLLRKDKKKSGYY